MINARMLNIKHGFCALLVDMQSNAIKSSEWSNIGEGLGGTEETTAKTKVENKKQKANDTGASRVLSHPSTIPAHACLTSQIGRDTVYSDGYGRWQMLMCK